MRDKGRHVRLQVDAYTRFCLTALVVLMSVMIVGLWAEGTPTGNQAVAAGQSGTTVERYQPRSTIDIGQLVEVQERTNDKLDQIIQLLKSGTINVKISGGEVLMLDRGGEKHEMPSSDESEPTGGLRPGVHVN